MRLSGKLRRILLLLLVCLSSSGFASEPAGSSEQDSQFWQQWNDYISELIKYEVGPPDPWEPFNRKVFAFNDTLDRYLLTPAAKSYQWLTPDPVETGLSNMFSNLQEITTILNDLLQLKWGQADADNGRFTINTTVGLLGLFDVASAIGLERHEEDFGQTLGYWGVGAGPYVVLPLLGPLNVRDSLGAYANSYTAYTSNIDHVRTRNQLFLVNTLGTRASLFSAEELITGDRYTFIRDAYLQRREYLLNDGVVEDSFGDEDFEDEWADEFEWVKKE